VITRPLQLESRLAPPPRDFDFLAWVNVGLIALFFGLLGSRFVLAPGVAVAVGDPNGIHLPAIGAGTEATGAASVVVSFRRDRVIVFEGGVYSLAELQAPIEAYAKAHPGAVMLVRADQQVTMQAFLNLCEAAKAAGFSRVLLAGEPGPEKNGEPPAIPAP
jgi:biopolymer transport protein ExbD